MLCDKTFTHIHCPKKFVCNKEFSDVKKCKSDCINECRFLGLVLSYTCSGAIMDQMTISCLLLFSPWTWITQKLKALVWKYVCKHLITFSFEVNRFDISFGVHSFCYRMLLLRLQFWYISQLIVNSEYNYVVS